MLSIRATHEVQILFQTKNINNLRINNHIAFYYTINYKKYSSNIHLENIYLVGNFFNVTCLKQRTVHNWIFQILVFVFLSLKTLDKSNHSVDILDLPILNLVKGLFFGEKKNICKVFLVSSYSFKIFHISYQTVTLPSLLFFEAFKKSAFKVFSLFYLILISNNYKI